MLSKIKKKIHLNSNAICNFILCYYFAQRSKIKGMYLLGNLFPKKCQNRQQQNVPKNSVCTGCELSNECISYSGFFKFRIC